MYLVIASTCPTKFVEAAKKKERERKKEKVALYS